MSFNRTISTPVLLAFLIFITLFFLACSDKIKTDIIAFKALDESLITSNRVIETQSQAIMKSLENKLTDPATVEKAKLWFPKAKYIETASKEITTYIEGIKLDLKRAAGLKEEGSNKSFRENDKNAVVRLLYKKGIGKDLYERLKEYKKNILSVNQQLIDVFEKTIVLTTSSFDAINNEQDFTKTFFDDIPTVAALAMLSKLQNNIRIIENKMISFCHEKTNSVIIIDWWPMPLVSQNVSHVKAEELIEITAGIGYFSPFRTEININGKTIPIDEIGAAKYTFKASNKPGNHYVPIRISFIDQEGKQQTASKTIEYTVIQ